MLDKLDSHDDLLAGPINKTEALDKREYLMVIFLISHLNHMM